MASEWHTSFCQSRERTQNFHTFSPSWPSVRIQVWGTHASCLSVASLSPVPLCLSPSDFLDNPYLTFHIQMIYRKGFWSSLWSRSFSDIQKSEESKTLLYAYLSVGEGTKFPPLLSMLKNSLLNPPVSQGGEGPSFLYSCKFPNSSDSSDGTKTSLPTRGTIQDFYQLIFPDIWVNLSTIWSII